MTIPHWLSWEVAMLRGSASTLDHVAAVGVVGGGGGGAPPHPPNVTRL
jgi:hypothetical protein